MTGPAPETQVEEKPQTTPQEPAQPDLFLHPDDLELAELERLAAEEEKSAPVIEEEPQPQPQPQPEPQPQPQPMIPKARLDEVLRQGGELQQKLDELARHNAYLAGQLETYGRQQQPAGTPQQPVLDPVAQVTAKLKALGARYDAGEVSMEELLVEREALDEEARQARIEASRPDPAELAARISRDPIVTEATARMEAANPWFANIPQHFVQRMLVDEAKQMLAERGIELTTDARSTLILRQAVIDVAKMAGMDLKYGGTPQPQPQPQPNGVTPAERQAKLDLQQRLPPNTARIGTSQQIDTMSPETLAEMSDSDLAALPASVLDRLAAGTR